MNQQRDLPQTTSKAEAKATAAAQRQMANLKLSRKHEEAQVWGGGSLQRSTRASCPQAPTHAATVVCRLAPPRQAAAGAPAGADEELPPPSSGAYIPPTDKLSGGSEEGVITPQVRLLPGEGGQGDCLPLLSLHTHPRTPPHTLHTCAVQPASRWATFLMAQRSRARSAAVQRPR